MKHINLIKFDRILSKERKIADRQKCGHCACLSCFENVAYNTGRNSPAGEDYSQRRYSWNIKPSGQSRSSEGNVVSWRLLQTVLSNLLWVDWMKQTCPENLPIGRAGLKTAGVTSYKIRPNEVYNLFYCSLMCSCLKKNDSILTSLLINLHYLQQ